MKVHLRPLKYTYERDAMGRIASDSAGNRIVKGRPREKGVDVLCALALVAQAQSDDIDLVILASHDTDLAPALDEAIRLGTAKVETFSWYDGVQGGYQHQLRPTTSKVWNTRLGEIEFFGHRHDPGRGAAAAPRYTMEAVAVFLVLARMGAHQIVDRAVLVIGVALHATFLVILMSGAVLVA